MKKRAQAYVDKLMDTIEDIDQLDEESNRSTSVPKAIAAGLTPEEAEEVADLLVEQLMKAIGRC